jgi:hypothetical protein
MASAIAEEELEGLESGISWAAEEGLLLSGF